MLPCVVVIATVLVVVLLMGAATFVSEVDRLEQDAIFSVYSHVEQPVCDEQPVRSVAVPADRTADDVPTARERRD